MTSILTSKLIKGTQHLTIDCRFSYEYEGKSFTIQMIIQKGGHIQGAVNCVNPQKIQELLFGF